METRDGIIVLLLPYFIPLLSKGLTQILPLFSVHYIQEAVIQEEESPVRPAIAV